MCESCGSSSTFRPFGLVLCCTFEAHLHALWISEDSHEDAIAPYSVRDIMLVATRSKLFYPGTMPRFQLRMHTKNVD